MKQSLKIKIIGKFDKDSYIKYMQNTAKNIGVEGTIQAINDHGIIIHAASLPDKLDIFIDYIYKNETKVKIEDVLVEPFVLEKDYRGVFRIIL